MDLRVIWWEKEKQNDQF